MIQDLGPRQADCIPRDAPGLWTCSASPGIMAAGVELSFAKGPCHASHVADGVGGRVAGLRRLAAVPDAHLGGPARAGGPEGGCPADRSGGAVLVGGGVLPEGGLRRG